MSAAIITGVFTLAGALGGVWLAHTYAARLAREKRAEEGRNAQRRLVVDIIASAREKDRLLDSAMVADRGNWSEEARAQVWRSYGAATARLEPLLVEALLSIGDTRLAEAIGRVQRSSPLFDADRALVEPGSVSVDSAPRAEFHEAVRDLQDVAAETFRSAVPMRVGRKRWTAFIGRPR